MAAPDLTTSPAPPEPAHPGGASLLEIGAVFLKIGATAFGGPAAHVAIMRDELVDRRRWVDDQHFLDLLGATNLIPGPNSSEMSMHLGYVQGGLAGLIVGGGAFLLPAMVMTLALAWAYKSYGATPAVEWLLYGIAGDHPLIVALIALVGRARPAHGGAGVAAFVLYSWA